MNQKGGFLRPLIRAGIPLMRNVPTTLVKTIMIPLGLMATA